jgi:hypothetical protein
VPLSSRVKESEPSDINCQNCQHIPDWRSIRIGRIGKCTHFHFKEGAPVCLDEATYSLLSSSNHAADDRLYQYCRHLPSKEDTGVSLVAWRQSFRSLQRRDPKKKSNNYFFRNFKGITYGQLAKFEFEFYSPFGK